MAAFLDVTHGLYSLSWSTPIEWPNFLQEYEAYYRSREGWTDLFTSNGFSLLKPENIGDEAAKLFYGIDKPGINKDGSVRNVIKAYHATYICNSQFEFPRSSSKNSLSTSTEGSKSVQPISVDEQHKRLNNTQNVTNDNSHENNGISVVKYTALSKKRSIDDISHADSTLKKSDTDKHELEVSLFESNKYPGKFYFIESISNKSTWVDFSPSDPNVCFINDKKYRVNNVTYLSK